MYHHKNRNKRLSPSQEFIMYMKKAQVKMKLSTSTAFMKLIQEKKFLQESKLEYQKKEHVVMNLLVKLDTGGNANILTLRSFKQMYPENVTENDEIINADFVTKSKTMLIGYSGEKINNIGTMTIKCGKDRIPQVFFITQTDGPNLLSLQGCRALDLVKIN
ncbi:hypothetical protein PoB_005126600 [Plakobranchus ocellatus]|uniref:Peptidase A2 domain-containing protein n=1 Tax=Plakobranchus ocellatus TaxID=259542 RepID=A0AAV4BND1_9GAST|nr:hypothetical protein PoB_005126600 [Plakobranchus ocellatus]